MKKILFFLSFLFISTIVSATPAMPGQWKAIRLADGTEVMAQLCGDEHVHFWMTEDGQRYLETDGTYTAVTVEQLQQRLQARRSRLSRAAARLQSPSKVSTGERTHYTGKKKGIVILAQFTDVQFKSANNQETYHKILNEEGYSEGKFRGSVADYFKAQSNGIFELTFDVVGPYTMEKQQSYYGSNDSEGNDKHPDEMIVEACQQADAEVDFSDYDWDGDGVVDQVFVVYAGKGEADGGAKTTIWPHMYYLSATELQLTLDGVLIDTYACSNELSGSSITGIGTFCHEFSHCLGFPDFYDISYSGWAGMGDLDLMHSGSYNGNTFCPCGYTAHEKMMCGWKEPVVLSDNDTTIVNLKPMSDQGDTYIIYNDNHPDEYFMIENRQRTGWDTSYPAKGLLITHVDFDQDIWEWNIPNTKITSYSDYHTVYGYPINDHQRMIPVAADNKHNAYTFSSDLYPYGSKDSLTASSKPAALYYNEDAKGSKIVKWAILDIKQNSDGTMSFSYRAPQKEEKKEDDPVTPIEGCLFYESFNQCDGKGGNDGLWNGSIASSAFTPDNEGWTSLGDKSYGADACAKFGTSSVYGLVSTPLFNINGTATLTFKAGAWDATNDGTTLFIEASDATVSPTSFTIAKGDWTECEATITGTGNTCITFTPDKRFFLDEVLVVQAETPTAIQSVSPLLQSNAPSLYDLQGRRLTDGPLKKGIYIKNGKKIIVK